MPNPPNLHPTRREVLRRIASLSSLVLLEGCSLPSLPGPDDIRGPRLNVRPAPPTLTPTTGIQPLRRSGGRGGLLFVPPTYRAEVPLPMVVLLHGAGRDSNELMNAHIEQAQGLGIEVILVAPDSRDFTWDRLSNGYFGPDIEYLEYAMGYAFARCSVDANRISIAGFSDGATYALGLGLANGDFLARAVAYSPGGILGVSPVGKPKFFITHGTQDTILPIDQASRTIVPALREAGYEVEYREWNGGHGVTMALLREALAWTTA